MTMQYGFVQNIEGYLGKDSGDFDVLIILREPHNKENEQTEEFWLKNELEKYNKTGKCNATRYINLLGRLVGMVTGVPIEQNCGDKMKQCAELLQERCAFMNLSPFKGATSKTEIYDNILGEFKDLSFVENYQTEQITAKSPSQKIAKNRMQIIRQFAKNGDKPKYIITTEDIFNALLKNNTVEKSLLKHKNKVFCKGKIGNNTTVFSFYHPSYTHIRYYELEK